MPRRCTSCGPGHSSRVPPPPGPSWLASARAECPRALRGLSNFAASNTKFIVQHTIIKTYEKNSELFFKLGQWFIGILAIYLLYNEFFECFINFLWNTACTAAGILISGVSLVYLFSMPEYTSEFRRVINDEDNRAKKTATTDRQEKRIINMGSGPRSDSNEHESTSLKKSRDKRVRKKKCIDYENCVLDTN